MAQALSKTLPSDASAEEKKRLEKVLVLAKQVDAALDAQSAKTKSALGPARIEFRAAWRALHAALGALAELPARFGDEGARSSRLLVSLFPNGVSFASRDAHVAWGDGARLLGRIADEKLAKEIEALLGPQLLAWTRDATAALEAAFLAPKKRRGRGGGVRKALRAFDLAVARYTRLLAASVEVNEPKSVRRFMRAVDPLENMGS